MINGRYVKKPIPVQMLEATSSDDLHARPDIIWRKTRIDGGEVYNDLHMSWIGFSFGDVFNVSNPSDIYPIERRVFESTYEECGA